MNPQTFNSDAAAMAMAMAGRGYGGAQAQPINMSAMGPGPTGVHIDSALSQFAVQYRPNEGTLIADFCSPVIPVNKQSDKYFVFDPANNIGVGNGQVSSAAGTPTTIPWGMSSPGAYNVQLYGHRLFVPLAVQANADAPLNPEFDATEVLLDQLALEREYRVAQIYTTSGNYGSNTRALTGAQQWDNPGSDPVADITNALSTAGLLAGRPNTAVFSQTVWDALSRHPAIERYILGRAATSEGATPLGVTTQMFAQRFGLRNVYVGSARYNNAAPGASVSASYVWARCAAFVKIEARPSMQRTQNFMYTMRWTPSGRDLGATPFQVVSWFTRDIGAYGGTYVQAVHADADEVIAGTYGGFLFTTPIA
jgi:hypothetical protein